MVDSLSINNLEKSYNGTFLFQDFNYDFSAGRYAIFGANGCGKSTLLKMMAGLIQPDKGCIRFNRLSTVFNNTAFKKLFSYVPDTPLIYPFMNGGEFIKFIKKIKQVTDKTYIEELLSFFNLTDHLMLPFHKMSFGTQKKFLITAAFLGNPKLVILDEPTIGLDTEVCNTLHTLITTSEIPIIICSTHDQDFAQQISATCLTLKAPPHEDFI